MQKTHRNHVNIQIAFNSSIRQMSVPSKPDSNMVLSSRPRSTFSSFVFFLKKTIRFILAMNLRLIKSVLQPIFFRIRKYLISPLQESTQSDLETTKVLLSAINKRLDKIENYSMASARRVTIQCKENILIHSQVGYILCPEHDISLIPCLIDLDENAQGIHHLIKKCLQPGDTFIDVGAHLGLYTLAAAKAMQGNGKIIAFEPFEPMQKLFKRTLELNGYTSMVEIRPEAVSNYSGMGSLHLPTLKDAHFCSSSSHSSENSLKKEKVTFVKLDDVVNKNSCIKLMKIDVRGHTLDIAKGANELIKSNPNMAIIIKFTHSDLYNQGYSTKDWLLNFKHLGLTYKIIHPKTGHLGVWSIQQMEAAKSVHLLFARYDSNVFERLNLL